jgi:hypothetical protein
MTYVRHETLQMLVTVLRPFKEPSLLVEADAYTTLSLVLPVRFNLLNYLNILIDIRFL